MFLVSISVETRKESIPEIQEVLTKYGKNISTRLGIHNNTDSNDGIIIVVYMEKDIGEFINDLKQVKETRINYMEI